MKLDPAAARIVLSLLAEGRAQADAEATRRRPEYAELVALAYLEAHAEQAAGREDSPAFTAADLTDAIRRGRLPPLDTFTETELYQLVTLIVGLLPAKLGTRALANRIFAAGVLAGERGGVRP